MATSPPTRFLVQHCLQGGESSATIREISVTTFIDVAFAVLTNDGQYSPVEVAGLSLEAFQPDFHDWSVAQSINDLMASRKLRVIATPAQTTDAPLPQYVPPAPQQHLPPMSTAPPPLPQIPATPAPAPLQQHFVAPPPQQVSQPVAPMPVAPSAPTSITIEMKDVLLAIGSLPRTTEPSCSSVLEHLARQRLPSLGAMVEDAFRECGHQPVWVDSSRPVRPPVGGSVSTGNERRSGTVPPVDDPGFATLVGLFDRRSLLKSYLCDRLRSIPGFGDRGRIAALFKAAIEKGLIKESRMMQGSSRVPQLFCTLLGPAGARLPRDVEEVRGAPISDADLAMLTDLFEARTMIKSSVCNKLLMVAGFKDRERQDLLFSTAVKKGVMKEVWFKPDNVKDIQLHFTLLGLAGARLSQNVAGVSTAPHLHTAAPPSANPEDFDEVLTEVTDEDLSMIIREFKDRKPMTKSHFGSVFKENPRFRNKENQKLLVDTAIQIGLIKEEQIKNGKMFHPHYFLLIEPGSPVPPRTHMAPPAYQEPASLDEPWSLPTSSITANTAAATLLSEEQQPGETSPLGSFNDDESSIKRPREDQDEHHADHEHELEQRRTRTETETEAGGSTTAQDPMTALDNLPLSEM